MNLEQQMLYQTCFLGPLSTGYQKNIAPVRMVTVIYPDNRPILKTRYLCYALLQLPDCSECMFGWA